MRELTQNNRFKKINIIILITLIVLQPILDTYYLYSDKVVNLIGFSPATIIRIILVGISFLLTFFTINQKKKWYYIFTYGGIIGIYVIAHHFHCDEFTNLVPSNVKYSLFSDIFYIIQLILPALVIFTTYYSGIKEKTFERVIFLLIIITSGSIVVSNILQISLGSYNNEVIKGSMIDWLFKGYGEYSYYDYASKGFFYFANRVSTALLMLLPINFYYVFKKINIKKIVILLLHILSMFMLGTKVAALGSMLVFGTMCIIYGLFCVIRKDIKFNKYAIVIMIFVVVGGLYILPKSPAIYREKIANSVESKYDKDEQKDEQNKKQVDSAKPYTNNDGNFTNNAQSNIEIKESNTTDKKVEVPNTYQKNEEKDEKQEKINFIRDNYAQKWINPKFILKSYPYEEDPDFWLGILNEPTENRLNYRYIETKMIQRAKELNNNKLDTLLGISYSRVQSIYNIERDFVLQYYSLGIIGVILLLGPMVFIVVISGLACICKFKKNFNMENISLCASGFLALAVSWYSGNSLDSLFISIILAFILGKLLFNIFPKENKKIC